MLSGFELYPRWVPLTFTVRRKRVSYKSLSITYTANGKLQFKLRISLNRK